MGIERIKSWTKKNGPTICTIGACIGICTDVIFAVRAGVKTTTRLDEIRDYNADYVWEHREEYDIDSSDTYIDLSEYVTPTKVQIIKACWKDYFPVFGLTLFTMLCAIGSNKLNRRNQAALASAYFGLKQYATELQKTLSANGVNGIAVSEELLHESLDDFISEDDEKHLFYYMYVKDDIGTLEGQYFESTIRDVVLSEYHINRNFILRGSATLNETLKWFNLKKVTFGEALGWDVCNDTGYQWIDFTHEKVENEDGLECYIITCDFDASPFDYENA